MGGGRGATGLALGVVLAVLLGTPLPAHADRYSAPLRTAVGDLRVAGEVRDGYEREKFRHWVDADGDGCSTREEVLLAEATREVSVTESCTITRGRWRSSYDRRVWTDPGDLDIDHLVPLAEAWDSGARRWRASVRQRFANDLGDQRSLAAVTDDVNQAKGDQDPDDWLPRFGKCRYVRQWVAVKHRWRLRVDRSEKAALRARASSCANSTITVTRAR